MISLRSTLIFGAVLVAAVVGVVLPNGLRRAGLLQAQSSMLAVSGQQAVGLADRVNALLASDAPEERRLRVFVKSAERCVNGDDGACRQMGELLLRQQELEREGRRPQVAALLKSVREARAGGTPEPQVRSMVRTALANGELSLSAESECRAIRQQIEELNRELVAEEMLAAGGQSGLIQVSAR